MDRSWHLSEQVRRCSSQRCRSPTSWSPRRKHLTQPTVSTKGHNRTLPVSPNDEIGTVAGIAVYYPNYSTWTDPASYIEDLIIISTQRRRGYGSVLFSALAREVSGTENVKGVNEYGIGRLQWSELKWNKPSIELFLSDKIGAVLKEEYIECQMDGKRLASLAALS